MDRSSASISKVVFFPHTLPRLRRFVAFLSPVHCFDFVDCILLYWVRWEYSYSWIFILSLFPVCLIFRCGYFSFWSAGEWERWGAVGGLKLLLKIPHNCFLITVSAQVCLKKKESAALFEHSESILKILINLNDEILYLNVSYWFTEQEELCHIWISTVPLFLCQNWRLHGKVWLSPKLL